MPQGDILVGSDTTVKLRDINPEDYGFQSEEDWVAAITNDRGWSAYASLLPDKTQDVADNKEKYGWEVQVNEESRIIDIDDEGHYVYGPMKTYKYYGVEVEPWVYKNWLKEAQFLYDMGWEIYLDENRQKIYYYYRNPDAVQRSPVYQNRQTGQYVSGFNYFNTKEEALAHLENTPKGVQYTKPAYKDSVTGTVVFRDIQNPGEPDKRFIPEGYVMGRDNVWRRYGGAEEMFYDPRARRPYFAGGSKFGQMARSTKPRTRQSQRWNPSTMGDRPASIVTGAGEKLAYQDMPYYEYGPNYYDWTGYTTGGYSGKGALPSQERRGPMPFPGRN